jgi:hypothetical protein
MGFWSTFGKIALPAASIAAAPFTGGSSLLGLLGTGGKAVADIIGKAGPAIGAAGSALGAASQGAATNRGQEFSGQALLEQLLQQRDSQFQNQTIAREQEGRASGTDAWRKLLASQRTLSPSTRPSLSPYSVAPRQATDTERQGASAMSAEVMARLQGGNPMAPVTQRPLAMDPSLLQAGGLEKTSGWLAPLLTFLGQQKKVA